MKTLSEKENFLAISEKHSNLENSKIAIVSAPYEETTSWGAGAGKGPEAILKASAYVEFYDDEFENELCFEKGIAAMEAVDFKGKIEKEALDIIEDQVSWLLERDKLVVTLGGEHTVSAAPIAAHFKKYPNMSILHFDAHADLRDEYEGSRYSHACIMRRVCDFFPPERITQTGIRALSREEDDFIRNRHISTFFASAVRRNFFGEDWKKSIVETLGSEVYVSFDVDYFDTAIMPATGTPEPDGFLYGETLDIFREMKHQGKKIIGFDVVELAPIEGMHHCDITAARLIYKMMNFAF